MTWKEVRKNGQFLHYLPTIWQTEAAMPTFFKASSWLWTKDFEAFVRWAVDCQEIHALFNENGSFVACVYVEKQDRIGQMVVHCSVVDKIDPQKFVAKYAELRDKFFHRGISTIRGWVLRQNFPFVKLMKEIGFASTGLKMDCGNAHNQVLHWDLMEIRTA